MNNLSMQMVIDIDLSGLGAGTAYTEGEYCFTVNKTTTYTGTDGSGSGGHGTSPHVASDGTSRTYIALNNSQDVAKMAVKCKTGSIPTASDGYAYSYEIIDSLDKRGTEAGSALCDDDSIAIQHLVQEISLLKHRYLMT